MKNVIAWWSGGVSSAVTCKLAVDMYGLDSVRIVFIDTFNEHRDTYTFKAYCARWYGKEIDTISAIGERWGNIKDVWRHFKSLNIAGAGGICSSELKRDVRERWQKDQDFDHQAFGFDVKEVHRARSMRIQHSKIRPIFPLLNYGYDKQDCINILEKEGIPIPAPYALGFHNNNCFNTGCVQGGIGYWQKMKREHPGKFDAMAEMERELTIAKGQPVTVLKRQDKVAIETGNNRLFLKANKGYPEVWSLADVKLQKEKPMLECNGFCGTNDLKEKL